MKFSNIKTFRLFDPFDFWTFKRRSGRRGLVAFGSRDHFLSHEVAEFEYPSGNRAVSNRP